jgi:hypothetical protein
MPPDGTGRGVAASVDALCDRWRRASLALGWSFPTDWWTPAVETLAEALCDGRDPAGACTELGRARARAAIGLDEALRDLAALVWAYAAGADAPLPTAGALGGAAAMGLVAGLDAGAAETQLPAGGLRAVPADVDAGAMEAGAMAEAGVAGEASGLAVVPPAAGQIALDWIDEPEPGLRLVTAASQGMADPAWLDGEIGAVGLAGLADCGGVPGSMLAALALGWSDVTCDPTAGAGCEDPLTGLVTTAYLRVRLGEVYREASRRGRPVPAEYAFVVAEVDMHGAGKLTQVSRSMLLAHCLRSTFAGGETLCGAGPSRALALVRRDGGLAAWAGALRHLLSVELDPFTERAARVWVESLPGTLAAAHILVAELAR